MSSLVLWEGRSGVVLNEIGVNVLRVSAVSAEDLVAIGDYRVKVSEIDVLGSHLTAATLALEVVENVLVVTEGREVNVRVCAVTLEDVPSSTLREVNGLVKIVVLADGDGVVVVTHGSILTVWVDEVMLSRDSG